MNGWVSATSASGDLSAQQIRDQLARILQTPDFALHPRTSALLTYVVEQALSGRGDEVKEAVLGVEVFGREPGYDSRSDSIVRTQARRVREKLAQYYSSAGAQDPVAIDIPKGTYVPTFRAVRNRPAGNAPAQSRWRVVAAAATFVAVVAMALLLVNMRPHPPAVLPTLGILSFTDLDQSHRYGALASGLTEDLERDLSRITSLRVHVGPLEGAEDGSDYEKLSQRLGADAVLDGAIAGTANHPEVRVRLIRESDHSVLWTDHFPAGDEIGSVETRIESNVARALNVKTVVLPRPENPEAHNLFFAARAVWARRGPEDNRQAIALFNQALKIDPNYALAYMGLADTYGLMTAHGQIDSKTGIELGERAAKKALELDPSLAEAHAAMGLIWAAKWNWKEAGAEYQRAIDLNPSYDRAYERYGVIHFIQGDFPAAERLLRESERLDPYAMSLPLIRAEIYYYWRRYDDSERLIHDVQKAEPGNVTAFQLLARDYLEQHRPKLALEAARAAVAQKPNELLFKTELVSYLEASGNQSEAAQVLEQVLHPKTARLDVYLLAMMYARMGDKENTLKYLEAAWDQRVADLPSIRWEPALDLVRDDPRYRALVEKIYR